MDVTGTKEDFTSPIDFCSLLILEGFAQVIYGIFREVSPQCGAWKNEAEHLLIPSVALGPKGCARPSSSAAGFIPHLNSLGGNKAGQLLPASVSKMVNTWTEQEDACEKSPRFPVSPSTAPFFCLNDMCFYYLHGGLFNEPNMIFYPFFFF